MTAEYRSSGRRPRRFIRRKRKCAFCGDGVKIVDWKNVDTLKRYIMTNGSMRGRHKTGTCAKHQRQLATAIKRARYAVLLPYTTAHARFSGFDRR